ncbi:MAG: ABC transporter substrate-binding protein [Actinomycetia bacterium]|nr:ABC transporter substrate-binding protein [Actinomycetes bacterium]
MINPVIKRRIWALVLALVLVAAACGTDDTADDETAAQAEAAAAAAAAAEAEAEEAAATAAAAEAEAAQAQAALTEAQTELQATMEAAAEGDEAAQEALAAAEAALAEAEAMAAEAESALAEAQAEVVEAAPEMVQDRMVVLLPALRGEDWLCPNCSLGALLNLQPLYEPLIYHDFDTGEIVEGEGRLAKSWSVNDNFTEFVFEIHQGVQFHQGWGELTTDDIVFSHELAIREGTNSPAAGVLSRLRVEVVDDYNFKLVTADGNPVPEALPALSEMALSFPITSRKYIEEVGEEAAGLWPIGAGPYQFKSHTPGVEVVFEAFPDHYARPPSIGEVVRKAVPEFGTRLAMLAVGDADLMTLSAEQIPTAEAAKLGIQSLPNQSMPTIYLTGNYVNPTGAAAENPPPWSDHTNPGNAKLVREALSLAIDRQEIVDFVLAGRGTTENACVHSWWPHFPGFQAGCEADPFDPDRATSLLAEAGYASPADLEITIDLAQHPGRPWCGKVAEAVAQQWTNLGISVTTQFTEYGIVEGQTSNREANFAFCYPPPVYNSGTQLWSFYSRTTDRLSYSGESEELDRLINEALSGEGGSDEEKETTASALFDFAYENRLGLPIAFADLLYAKDVCLEWDSLPGTVAFYVHNYEFMNFTC